ncbi:MAG: transcription antitermination factor NusB [Acidobacteriota bacterium]|jgi:N utilization substance protein B
MPARHKSRQRALQVLFLRDQRNGSIEDAISEFYNTLGTEEDDPQPLPADEFMETLARGTSRKVQEIDERITAKASNWRIERMPAVDRNILRLAVYEMQSTPTPPAVVIDEALELAREFAGDESVSFINGVLDAVRRDFA